MHKKLATELTILANSILQMNDEDDVNKLHQKAQEIYEKLTVLKFIENNLTTATEPESEEKPSNKNEYDVVNEANQDESLAFDIVNEEEEVVENDADAQVEKTAKEIPSYQISLEEELKDAISADVATQLFEKATKENLVSEESLENKQRSLNDALFKNNLQIGLNDRIAFVKHLFEGNQEDFNRVLSQLNSFKNENEAKNFLNKLVKPDYDWSNKEEYEQRLNNLIERKFL